MEKDKGPALQEDRLSSHVDAPAVPFWNRLPRTGTDPRLDSPLPDTNCRGQPSQAPPTSGQRGHIQGCPFQLKFPRMTCGHLPYLSSATSLPINGDFKAKAHRFLFQNPWPLATRRGSYELTSAFRGLLFGAFHLRGSQILCLSPQHPPHHAHVPCFQLQALASG